MSILKLKRTLIIAGFTHLIIEVRGRIAEDEVINNRREALISLNIFQALSLKKDERFYHFRGTIV